MSGQAIVNVKSFLSKATELSVATARQATTTKATDVFRFGCRCVCGALGHWLGTGQWLHLVAAGVLPPCPGSVSPILWVGGGRAKIGWLALERGERGRGRVDNTLLPRICHRIFRHIIPRFLIMVCIPFIF